MAGSSHEVGEREGRKHSLLQGMIFASSWKLVFWDFGEVLAFWGGMAYHRLLRLLLIVGTFYADFRGRCLGFETWKSGMPFSNILIIF